MAGRYEVSEHGWHLVQELFSSHQATGRPRRDDRQMLNGILWILCSGAKWRDLPERYGPWKTVFIGFGAGGMTVPFSRSSRGYTYDYAKMV